MKQIFFFSVISILLFISVFYVVTEGKGTCKLCGTLGVSKTIEDAKNRNTFITELKPRITKNNDSLEIELNDNVVYFLEKRFWYGEYNAENIVLLEGEHEFKYQLSIQLPKNGYPFKQFYRTKAVNEKLGFYANKFLEIPDTINCKIITLSPPFDSIYVIGQLQLFTPAGASLSRSR